ncbi:MAG TPA: hypothetical protein VNO30_42255 [Kofleriaceae bacterium]|nr:hypothetical protein [Kofleriaceae bacterium]
MKLDEHLVYKFFVAFSRMEYALKRAGFAQVARHGGAEPAWDAFIASIESRWAELGSRDFTEARDYLLRSPPRRQVLRNSTLDWEETPHRANETEAGFIVRCVKRIRNNLFHGGKFPSPVGPVAPPERDTQLLKHSLVIMHFVLKLNERVKFFFEETV